MNEYKLSANSIGQIVQFLKQNFDFDWNFEYATIMLNQTDCFHFIGQIPNEINPETGEVLSWLDGLHFDILTNLDLAIPEGITQHFPNNLKHIFA